MTDAILAALGVLEIPLAIIAISAVAVAVRTIMEWHRDRTARVERQARLRVAAQRAADSYKQRRPHSGGAPAPDPRRRSS